MELYYRGLAKYRIQRYRESISDFDMAIEINPNNTNVYTFRADTKHRLGRYSEAIADYSEIINRNPNNRHYYYRRALAKKEIASLASAQNDLKMALLLSEKANDLEFSRKTNQVLSEIQSTTEDDIPF